MKLSKQYADMTYRLSDGRETTYKVELLPESEWPSKEQEIWFQAGVSGERERIIKLLEPHRITGKSVGGFLGVCSCGESIDDYQLHLIALIKGETNE